MDYLDTKNVAEDYLRHISYQSREMMGLHSQAPHPSLIGCTAFQAEVELNLEVKLRVHALML